MTKQDWRDLVFWMAASGAFLTAILLTFAIRDVVIRLLS
jgi:uncharacterized membrane protein